MALKKITEEDRCYIIYEGNKIWRIHLTYKGVLNSFTELHNYKVKISKTVLDEITKQLNNNIPSFEIRNDLLKKSVKLNEEIKEPMNVNSKDNFLYHGSTKSNYHYEEHDLMG